MICPYCKCGEVLHAIIKKTNMQICICDECDTVWQDCVNDKSGRAFFLFAKELGIEDRWDNLKIIEVANEKTKNNIIG